MNTYATLRNLLGTLLIGSVLMWTLGCPPADPDDPDVVVSYTVELAGENQSPPIASTGSGEVDVTLENGTLELDGEFDDLVSRLQEQQGSSINIYESMADEEDMLLFSGDVEPDDDERSGTFTASEELTADQQQRFRAGDFYVIIHTNAYPDGELSAPLNEQAPVYAGIDQSWGVELSAGVQPHAVETDASGWMWAILRNDNSFVISGAFQNLTSSLAEVDGGAVNLHEGEFGDTGDALFNLAHETTDEADNAGRFWYQTTLSDSEANELTDGNYYVNIFTDQYSEGELRGQLDDDEENGFFQDLWEDIFGDDPDDIDEAPPF